MKMKMRTIREACIAFGGEDTPISLSTYYRGIREGRYPKPVKISPGLSRIPDEEIEEAKRKLADARSRTKASA